MGTAPVGPAVHIFKISRGLVYYSGFFFFFFHRSGYYATRPWIKLLGRQVSSRLRATEILYTIASALAARRQTAHPVARTVLAAQFAQLEVARRALALFQHHDAITGTSKAFVMRDYEEKLAHALEQLNKLEALLVGYLLLIREENKNEEEEEEEELLLLLDDRRRRFVHLNPRNKGEEAGSERVLNFSNAAAEHVIVVYNALAQISERMGHFKSNAANICVYNSRGSLVDSQVAPSYNVTMTSLSSSSSSSTVGKETRHRPRLDLSTFDVWFTVILEPVSLAVFAVRLCDIDQQLPATQVYCLKCTAAAPLGGSSGQAFQLRPLPPGALQLENQLYRLLFDEDSRLLRTVTNKISGTALPVEINFAAYKSEVFR